VVVLNSCSATLPVQMAIDKQQQVGDTESVWTCHAENGACPPACPSASSTCANGFKVLGFLGFVWNC
jgi:hypothetical protein